MKKILIVNNNLHIGGVQKSLINLLWNIQDKYDVTLLLFYDGGALRKELPPGIKVQSVTSAYRWIGMNRYDAEKSLIDRLMRGFFAGITRIFGRKAALSLMKHTQRQMGPYDAAISYLHNSSPRSFYGGCNEFVLNHVNAPLKIAFLHCDYSVCGANLQNAKDYERFDRIAACSEGCAASFIRENPHLKEKVSVVRNCHRFEQIRSLAERETDAPLTQELNILTVARLSPEKGVKRGIRAVADLPIRYRIVGDGRERRALQAQISADKLHEKVILLGELENPYPYIRQADLLLIPSYHEAAPLVIDEAACLGTPILTTETCSAREMVEQRGFGWVCDHSDEAIRSALQELLKNPEKLAEKRCFLSNHTFNNEQALAEFDELLRR